MASIEVWKQLGQWMDTVTDDFGNVFFLVGATLNLHAAGIGWAVPVGLTGVCAFIITQSSQYSLLAFVYRSGDLAAIPWAFQSGPSSAEEIARRGVREWAAATIPQMLKRDFFLTVFVVLTIAGRLEIALAIFSAGSVAFLFSFLLQLVRNRGEIAAVRRSHRLTSDGAGDGAGADSLQVRKG